MDTSKVLDTATLVDQATLSDTESIEDTLSVSDTASVSDIVSVTENVMELLELATDWPFYKEVFRLFTSQWKHPGTTAKLKRIYVIKNRKDPKLQLRFHGTRRACTIGSGSLDPCDKPECNLCNILKEGFLLERAKASRYAKNLKGHVSSDEYVLILCGVDPGQSKDMATAGDPGECDTAEGLTFAKGGQLHYQETFVRCSSRITPLGLVVYSRTP
ncbi:hypothetical protein N7478_009620 [Penicillium angulare]|uniref:uncharacterized protein n=1 Tax=Penicillium angulare TaxID=116970 RepID=UPI0025401E40|nr:uncharacterized protein N7478_009620 [Penicillium angulare]KAJ5266812.1 hypothetical protein N7478_009620 [Penicillium angulare]